MSDNCCPEGSSDSPKSPASLRTCPTCGTEGTVVSRTTVSALTQGLVPPRQVFRLCRQPSCSTVYFGSLGDLFSVEDLFVIPGFKNDSPGWVCYCYHHSRQSLERELRETGSSSVISQITAEVQAGNCACDVRNPSGKCCLGEVQRMLQRVEPESAAIAKSS